MIAQDIQELVKTTSAKPPKMCSTRFIIEQYQGDDKTALIDLVDGGVVPSGKIVELLANHGHFITPALLDKHRRRLKASAHGCSCPVKL